VKVHLLVSTDVSGIKFYGLAERLREALKKNIDLINVEQLSDNMDLLNEIMKEGIRIYVQG
jgi:predicted nucleotidyltransferase